MKVEIDKKSGFCFGVQNAVEIAEKALLQGEKVFSLGPIVHNDKEVERLSSLGLVSINQQTIQGSEKLQSAYPRPWRTSGNIQDSCKKTILQ